MLGFCIAAILDTISSAKLEWLTQRHFGVSKASEFFLVLREGHNYYDPALLLTHPPPEVCVNDPDYLLKKTHKSLSGRVRENATNN